RVRQLQQVPSQSDRARFLFLLVGRKGLEPLRSIEPPARAIARADQCVPSFATRTASPRQQLLRQPKCHYSEPSIASRRRWHRHRRVPPAVVPPSPSVRRAGTAPRPTSIS